jgi:ketosteroid isomerase-like protein
MRRNAVCLAISFVLLGLITSGCKNCVPHQAKDAIIQTAAIRAALDRQVQDWNAGNLAGFMETYAKSEQTRFASGGEITRGWQSVFDRYQKKYGAGAGMGTLNLTNLEITVFGPDAALAFGRWQLMRDGEEFSGLFTLTFRKASGGWRIIHDHTSSAAKP